MLAVKCVSDFFSSMSGVVSGEEAEEYDHVMHRELQRRTMEGSREALECMVEKGLAWDRDLTEAKETPVHTALRQKDFELLQTLLQIQNLVHLPNVYGEAPIHLACRLGLEDAVRFLLKAGAEVNALDSEDCSPLFHAVHGRSLGCARLLIQAGCDLDTLNSELLAPLDSALLHKDYNMVALLLRSGCSTRKVRGHVYWHDHYSNSLVHALCNDGTLETMQLYFDCGYMVSDSEMSSLRTVLQQPSSQSHAGGKLQMLQAVMEFRRKPKSLMWYCRQTVRQCLMETRCLRHTPMEAMVSSLPVPGKLKGFLSLTGPPAQEGSDGAELGDRD